MDLALKEPLVDGMEGTPAAVYSLGAQRLMLAVARLEGAAEALGHPAILEHLASGARAGFLVASAEWLSTEDACLVAGRCSRQTLKAGVKRGLVVERFVGDRPVYSRASIAAAIQSGDWGCGYGARGRGRNSIKAKGKTVDE